VVIIAIAVSGKTEAARNAYYRQCTKTFDAKRAFFETVPSIHCSGSTYHRLGDVSTKESKDNSSFVPSFDFDVEENLIGYGFAGAKGK
jgi:hypothetical protein